MCDECNQTEAADSGLGYVVAKQNNKIAEPSLRDRLEKRRNHLTRQLAQIEAALQLIYTNPDAERIHEIISRA